MRINIFRNRKLILRKIEAFIDERDALIHFISSSSWYVAKYDEKRYGILDRAIKRLWKLYYK